MLQLQCFQNRLIQWKPWKMMALRVSTVGGTWPLARSWAGHGPPLPSRRVDEREPSSRPGRGSWARDSARHCRGREPRPLATDFNFFFLYFSNFFVIYSLFLLHFFYLKLNSTLSNWFQFKFQNMDSNNEDFNFVIIFTMYFNYYMQIIFIIAKIKM